MSSRLVKIYMPPLWFDWVVTCFIWRGKRIVYNTLEDELMIQHSWGILIKFYTLKLLRSTTKHLRVLCLIYNCSCMLYFVVVIFRKTAPKHLLHLLKGFFYWAYTGRIDCTLWMAVLTRTMECMYSTIFVDVFCVIYITKWLHLLTKVQKGPSVVLIQG